MAGAGFRTFASGEVLTATNVNTYLMEQTIMVFADATARNTAITSPSEGMFVFLKDANTLQYYDGASWLPFESGGAGLQDVFFLMGA